MTSFLTPIFLRGKRKWNKTTNRNNKFVHRFPKTHMRKQIELSGNNLKALN